MTSDRPYAATLALILAPIFASVTQAAESGWQQTAATDIAAMRKALEDNSPAVYVNKDSQLFREWLEQGYTAAQRDLPRVMDVQSYYYLLRGYAGGFRDSHITLSMEPSANWAAKVIGWPGMATAWKNGTYRVAYVDPARASQLPPVGSILTACDGQPTEEVAHARLDRYEADLHLESGRYFSAPKLLWDMGNPFAGPLPKHCTFRIAGIGSREFTLKFVEPEAGMVAFANKAAAGAAKPPLGIERWLDQGWWIGLPSLLEEQDWKSFFAAVERHRDEVRSAPVVVFDVRGDKGGDSVYAERLANMLWGQEMVQAYEPYRGDEVYRVSPLNRRFFADSLDEFAAKHEVNEYTVPFTELVKKMDAALAQGMPLVTMHNAPPERPDLTPVNPMKGTVVLLTDYVCNSACLYMLDLYLRFPNTLQAGVTTTADTIFMEVGREALPSGKARVSFGHKAWITRPRGTNVPYTPAAAFTYLGDLGDDQALHRWLSQLSPIACARPTGK